MGINATGAFNLTRLAVEHLMRVTPEDTPDGERGVIILVASEAAVRCPLLLFFHICLSSYAYPIVRWPAWTNSLCRFKGGYSLDDTPYGA